MRLQAVSVLTDIPKPGPYALFKARTPYAAADRFERRHHREPEVVYWHEPTSQAFIPLAPAEVLIILTGGEE